MPGIVRFAINVLTTLSLILLVAVIGLGVRGRCKALDACLFGYWGYTPHPYARGYFNALELHLFNTPGRIACTVYRQECVAGPGRFESFPWERGTQLRVNPNEAASFYDYHQDAMSDPQATSVCGVRYVAVGVGPLWDAYAVSVPHAVAAVVFAILPMGRCGRWVVRRRRRKAGHCSVCGYDLRASPERCPECGTMIPRRQDQASAQGSPN